jgi:hypothetical protein
MRKTALLTPKLSAIVPRKIKKGLPLPQARGRQIDYAGTATRAAKQLWAALDASRRHKSTGEL